MVSLKKKVSLVLGLTIMAVSVVAFTQKPKEIRLKNDDQVQVSLSTQDNNRIYVKNDRITKINSLKRKVIAHNDSSGSIYLTAKGEKPFTLYLTTEKGRHFSFLVTPVKSHGETIKIIPLTPEKIDKSKKNTRAKKYEQSSAYSKTLVRMVKAVMRGGSPTGFREIPEDSYSQFRSGVVPGYLDEERDIRQRVRKLWTGSDIAIRVLKVTNRSRGNKILRASEFYTDGVRAVAIQKELLDRKGSTNVYEVMSNE